MKLVRLGIDHKNKCTELDKICFQGLWSSYQWEKELNNNEALNFAYISSERILAMVIGRNFLDELQIMFIAVHPEIRGYGIGLSLMSFLLKEAKANGAKRATLEVKEGNQPAISFYKKLCFEVTGVRKNYYRDGSDALIFSTDLIIHKNEKKNNYQYG